MKDTERIDYESECKRYGELLLSIFKAEGRNLFNYACTLIRVGGLEDAGWDPLKESRELLEDIIKITHLDVLDNRFTEPDKTRWRLMLLSYAHLTEMDAVYDVLANLLRVKTGLSYVINPFFDLEEK